MFFAIQNYNPKTLTELLGGSMGMIIWGIGLGIFIGVLCAVIHNTCTGRFIRALIRGQIDSADKAKTVDALSVGGKWYLYSALNGDRKPLRRYVECANKDELTDKRGRAYVKAAKFYLPEENRISAELRFAAPKRPVFTVIFTVILVIAAGMFALYVLPDLLQMLSNFISSLSN